MRCSAMLILTLSLSVGSATAQTVTSTSGSQAGAQVGVLANPSQVLTLEAAPYPTATTTTVRNSPQVFAPSMQPTTPCTSVVSGGMSVVGFGMSLGGSYEDKECTRREFARVLAQMGYSDAGLAVLCRNEEVAAAAPQLCKRSAYTASRPEDYVSSEPPVMPPAKVMPNKEVATQQLATPGVGTTGYGINGQSFRWSGTAWVTEEAWKQQQQQAAEKALIPRPELMLSPQGATK
jgi:hypothetical protein